MLDSIFLRFKRDGLKDVGVALKMVDPFGASPGVHLRPTP